MVASGAKIILSKLPIGDVATQYFADRYELNYVSSQKLLTEEYCA